MEHPNNSASPDAIAQANQAAEDASFVERIQAIRKLKVDDLEKKLPELELVALRALLVAEEAEGEARARSTAIRAIEAAIDAHPEQIAALAEGESGARNDGASNGVAPAGDAGGSAGADGGGAGDVAAGQGGGDGAEALTAPAPIDMNIDDIDVVGDVQAPAGPDAIAAIVAAATPSVAEPRGIVPASLFDDECDQWTDDEVFAFVTSGAKVVIVIGRAAFAYPELAPVEVSASSFRRAMDAQRVVYGERIDLSGLALEAALPLEQAWLVFDTEDGPVIARRSDIATALALEPGRHITFPANSLIF